MSGLVCLRHLMPVSDVTVLEGRSSVGGLWAYLQEKNPIDQAIGGNIFQEKYGCQFRNIYEDLILNTPTVFSHFKDFLVSEEKPEFLTREDFNEYLKAYVEHFDLMSKVRLDAFVLEVRRVEKAENGMTFKVKVCNSINKNQTEVLYADFVVVANGHNNVPYLPAWNGAATFPGQIIHSHDFRRSDDPAIVGKSILVVGASYSGLDMLVKLFGHHLRGEAKVKKVYFSGTLGEIKSTTDFKKYIENEKLCLIDSRIERIEGSQVIFKNGEKIDVDLIIPCTGYKFSFPFLNKEDNLITMSDNNMYFGPLFRRTFAVNEPHLCFVGNVDRSCFIQQIMEYQALIIASYIKGELKLPDKDTMLLELENELQELQGDLKRNFFKPGCACLEDNKIIQGFFDLLPSLKNDEKFVENLNLVGKRMVEYFMRGDLITYRKTIFRKCIPDIQ